MRQALFAVVLVGASFAGGAAVNGPGLRWAQAWALGRLGLVHEHAPGVPTAAAPEAGAADPPADGRGIAPLALNEPGKPADAAKPADAGTTPKAPPDGPIAPEPGARGGSQSATATAPTGAAPVALAAADLPSLERPEPLSVPGETEPAAFDAPRGADAAKPAGDAKPEKTGRGFGDMTVALASMAGKAFAGAGNGAGADEPDRGRTPPPADAPKSGTAAAAAETSSASSTTALPGEPADWAGVRRALKLLGVSRYGTEAEPDGRARFHCVIPLAGRRAVGQHFEAEGDDELDAARAALRRIALWRASEEAPAPR